MSSAAELQCKCMAAKSVLHQFGWRRGEYNVKKVSAKFTSKSSIMDGSFRKQTNAGNEPPPKKRRTEDDELLESDELWDDSMEFTQADLDDLEMQASQAITHPIPAASEPMIPQARSIPPAGGPAQTQGTFLKPQLSRSSSSSASSGGNRFVRRTSGQSSHNSSHNSSHGSSHSNSLSHSSHSSYPGSLSGYSNTSSSSVRSGSSFENVGGPTSRSSRLSSGSLDITSSIVTGSQSSVTDINKMKQELAVLRLQVDNMKQEVCVKEGENKLLRENLTTREAELDVYKTEKINNIHQQNVQQTEREKTLQTEVSRLQTQLQFKDQEERERTSRIKELEKQVRTQHSPGTSTSSQGFPQSQSVSPKPVRKLVEQRSPQGHGGFPSKKSFMAAEVSPSKKVKVSQEVKISQGVKISQTGDNQENMTQTNLNTSKAFRLRKNRKHSCLKLSVDGSNPSGSQLVGRLLSMAPSETGTMSERGILGLLHTPCTSATLYNVQFDRDKDTSLLSPVRGRRLSDLQSLVTHLDKPDTVSLVPVDHFNMAVQGLSNLLKPRNQSDQMENSDWSIQTQMRLNVGGDNVFCVTDLEDAVLILPLISDYLRYYTEMLESRFDNSAASSVTNSSSSPDSFDTSSESPTGSLGLFLKNTADYANDLESLTIASLNTLHKLLSCAGVRRILLDIDVSIATMEAAEAEQSPSSETDLPVKDLSNKFTHIPRRYIVKLNILKKVIKLSNPGTKGRLYNGRIVSICLDILTVLAVSASDTQMSCLLPVLSEEGLQNCMETEGDPNIVVESLHLFKALLKSNQVVSSLCSNSTGCVLLTTYSLCIPERWTNVSIPVRLQIASLIVESIFYLASSHKGCFTLVLESDCQCSVEVVKSIVCLLHSVMKLYKKCKTDSEKHVAICSDQTCSRFDSQGNVFSQKDENLKTSLKILQTGLHLLHLMSQYDAEFTTRHIPVQHKYVRLICGLTHIFRHIQSGDNESEMNALQDLWDFNQDDSELSQDSDSDEQESMDNT